ncbi:Bug family tripartite tricarboxylate transporter substrate binding protein [Falsiroseomonas stagni]|uniref:Tripartite-type tricarboxylate transporter, receptor component TctC n=1 Tax=Falsiroseomonas stagni DSM 19981 TaxID=1123062 RepID=A0A1I4D1D2_9PROT|nr:tripartite tricarboxylate transporter substrate-binding protein [Falsiroseomonas stagni]SFK87474.1 Tripartite-type tricarboxylate transporter, receptor component TctC [Falsiroseomonas stagni DSM 19981]
MKRRLLGALSALLFVLPAMAADLPERPIRIIVPAPPGGTSDIMARVLAEAAAPFLPRGAVVENRGGAGGNIAAAEVARAIADGTTVLQCSFGPCGANPSLYANPGYDLLKDLAPVILTGAVRNVMSVRRDLPAQNVQELLALARARPGALTYGSSGVGASNHIGPELLRSLTGIEMQHVPYRGSGPATTDLIAGRIDIFFDNLPSILPHIRAGAVRPMAAVSAARLPELPDLPTFAEQGVEGMAIDSWFGFLAPMRTPAPAIAALNTAFGKALENEVVRRRLADLGVVVLGGTPAQMDTYMRGEVARWAEVVRKQGIRAE